MPPEERHPDRKGGTRGDAGRAERLAQQLRENLKRRKTRERGLQDRDTGKEDCPASKAAEKPG